MSGYDLLLKVKGKAEHLNKPFIMVTEKSAKEYVMQALSSGASSYILKPFTEEFFLEKVRRVLTSRPRKPPCLIALSEFTEELISKN